MRSVSASLCGDLRYQRAPDNACKWAMCCKLLQAGCKDSQAPQYAITASMNTIC